MLARDPKRRFRIKLRLPTDDIVEMTSLSPNTSVFSVKLSIEKEFGVPCFLQRLSYLDSVDLSETSNLQQNDVVSGGTIRLRTWNNWHSLVCAALTGDIRDLLNCGGELETTDWDKKRIWTLLYLAAFYGRFEVVLQVIENRSVNVNKISQSGRTALHAAAYRGNWKCLCALLEKGADITITDNDGYTALDLAKIGSSETCKDCEKSLTFCSWNLQKNKMIRRNKYNKLSQKILRYEGERQAHLFADSTLQTWYTGEYAQMYVSQTPNPVSLPSKKKPVWMKRAGSSLPPLKCDSQPTTTQSTLSQTESATSPRASRSSDRDMESGLDDSDNEQKQMGDQEWFDPVRAREIVPTGPDLIAYSEKGLRRRLHIRARVIPSPSSLQPPRRMPSSCKFEKRRGTDSRTDSRSVSDGLDFRTWLSRKEEELTKENEESKEREKRKRETMETEKRRRQYEAHEAFTRWLENKKTQPTPSKPHEEARGRNRTRHLASAVR
ncbi:uncharacterized protein LOC134178212 isoform X2 [Corticium candelabrum]|uniref:uncharacterized protein LOC134178212 isoform X2 n=1 Tax=Corticium candelabrum TaxID=121492 RepID=UPI002E261ED7|nr:uncharacterized protein LOC134178212 isoform X2 [Corticium candelabrum]